MQRYSSIKSARGKTKSIYRLFDKKQCDLGDNGGGETLYVEFKQFCILAIDNIFSNNQIEEFLYYEHRLDKDLFNEMIYNIINKNIKKYIAKYLGLFSKAQINGELYLQHNILRKDKKIVENIFINEFSNKFKWNGKNNKAFSISYI